MFKKELELLEESHYFGIRANLSYNNASYSVLVLNHLLGFGYVQSNYIMCYDIKEKKIKAFLLHKIKNIYLLNEHIDIEAKVLIMCDKIIDNQSFIEQETFEIEESKADV